MESPTRGSPHHRYVTTWASAPTRPGAPRSPALRDHLTAAKFDIEDGIANAEIMRRFKMFGTRRAILLKKVAEHRR
jgi:hypothetical protein